MNAGYLQKSFMKTQRKKMSKEKNVKLKQVRASKGLVTFTTLDNSLRITYQATYATPWKYKDKFLEDNPDIVIEKSDGTCFIYYDKSLSLLSDYSIVQKAFKPNITWKREQVLFQLRYINSSG